MKIGSVIQSIRKKRGISQGGLADRLDVTQSYLSQIESDKTSHSLTLLEKIAAELGVPAYFFLFAGLEEVDIAPEKRDAYKHLAPAVIGMIEGFFLAPD